MTGWRRPKQEEIDEAVRLREEGYTLEFIAESLNRSVPLVFKHTTSTGKRGKTDTITVSKINADENKRLEKLRKKNRELWCIPVVYCGMNTV